MVCIRCDVRYEFLRRERDQTGELDWRLRRRWEPGFGEVVVCYGVGDLSFTIVSEMMIIRTIINEGGIVRSIVGKEVVA